ncbi:MAG: D-sedoheptulose 7-phosphate isomerase [Myxococcota bacterium]
MFTSDGASISGFARAYLTHTAEILRAVDENSIGSFVEALMATRTARGTVWLMGNGGSAATANHFANDLAIGVKSRPAFRAVSLAANSSVLTAVGNDFGYEEIFTRQLQDRVEPNDIVVGISASGRSPNVVRALKLGRSVGATTVAITGFDGGDLRDLADIAVHAQTSQGEYGPVEAVHTVLLHIVSNYLMLRCRG